MNILKRNAVILSVVVALGSVLLMTKLHAEGPAFGDDAPFGVVMGDSLMQGAPALRSPINADGAGKMDLSYPNQPGQPSYELKKLTHLSWENRGFAGQNVTQIWERWSRDVLADPTTTLPRAAKWVVLSAGINDLAQDGPGDLPTREQRVRDHLSMMAKSARDHGITLVLMTLPPYRKKGPERLESVQKMNQWIRDELVPTYGVHVFDFYAWVEEETVHQSQPSPLFADHIHPTREGYAVMMQKLVEETHVWSQ